MNAEFLEFGGDLMEILKQFSNLLEDWIPKEASIAVAMGNQYVYYIAGKYDLKIKEGQKIQAR